MTKDKYEHTIKSLDDLISFGKYDGQSVAEVLKKDIQYMTWVHNKTKFKFGKRAFKEVELLYPDDKKLFIFKK